MMLFNVIMEKEKSNKNFKMSLKNFSLLISEKKKVSGVLEKMLLAKFFLNNLKSKSYINTHYFFLKK